MKFHEKTHKEVRGKDILLALIEGKEVYSDTCLSSYWYLNSDGTLMYCPPNGTIKKSKVEVNNLIGEVYYIEIPYDITADLIANPGKWVAEYEDKGVKYVVGFDYKECMAVRIIKENMSHMVRYGAGQPSGWAGSIPVGHLSKCKPL